MPMIQKTKSIQNGNIGAGDRKNDCWKISGIRTLMKSGIWNPHAVKLGDLKVGAIVSVNALGDILDNSRRQTGRECSADLSEFEDTEAAM